MQTRLTYNCAHLRSKKESLTKYLDKVPKKVIWPIFLPFPKEIFLVKDTQPIMDHGRPRWAIQRLLIYSLCNIFFLKILGKTQLQNLNQLKLTNLVFKVMTKFRPPFHQSSPFKSHQYYSVSEWVIYMGRPRSDFGPMIKQKKGSNHRTKDVQAIAHCFCSVACESYFTQSTEHNWGAF